VLSRLPLPLTAVGWRGEDVSFGSTSVGSMAAQSGQKQTVERPLWGRAASALAVEMSIY